MTKINERPWDSSTFRTLACLITSIFFFAGSSPAAFSLEFTAEQVRQDPHLRSVFALRSNDGNVSDQVFYAATFVLRATYLGQKHFCQNREIASTILEVRPLKTMTQAPTPVVLTPIFEALPVGCNSEDIREVDTEIAQEFVVEYPYNPSGEVVVYHPTSVRLELLADKTAERLPPGLRSP